MGPFCLNLEDPMAANERPLLNPPYPPFIDMGVCPDCFQNWEMSRSEYTHWVIEKLPKGMVMPKRCSECRSARRREQLAYGEKVRNQHKSLSLKLKTLAESVSEGVYEDNRYELALELLSLSEEAEIIPEKLQERGKPNEGKRPVQVHPRTVSDLPEQGSQETKALDQR